MLRKFLVALLILSLITAHEIYRGPSERTIRSKVVQLKGEKKGYCSGVQVHAPTGKDYILSAAHCSVLQEDGMILVRTDDSRFIPRRVLEISPVTDLMLLEGMPDLNGISVANDYEIGQHLRSFTHGAAFDTYKTEGELIQEKMIDILVNWISSKADEDACNLPKYKILKINTIFGEIQACALHLNMYVSTTKVVPGSSGGGIFDDRGKLVAIVSGGDATFGVFVTLADIQMFLSAY